MRKLLSIFSVALVALFAISCDKEPDQNNSGMTLNFGEPEVTSASIEVGLVPSNTETNYFAGIVLASEIAGKDDAAIIAEYIQKLTMYKGVQFISASGLMPETDYTAIAFYMGETSKVTKLNIRTEEATDPVDPSAFNVKINVSNITAYAATAVATPNSSANRYFFRVITKMELDAFGIYNDDYQIFEYIIENPNNNAYITQGKTTLNCDLYPEMDYLAVAFNFENWEAVHNREENVKLFRHAFKTPKADPIDPSTLFATANLSTTSSDFSLDVTPAYGEDSHWIYYIWTKKSFDETVANEASASIVMRSYWALQNLSVEQRMSFNELIQDGKLGQKGSRRINSYEPLKNNTDYVVVLFYIDPATTDPTVVTDYNYVPVEFKTQEPTAGAAATLEVSEPIITNEGFTYTVNFLVKTNENATNLLVGAQLWANYDFAQYWDPSDWSQIQAFFYRQPVGAETLAAAKTAEGATISFPDVSKDDYVFFFEVLNAENTPTQYAIRVTPDMF